MMVELLKGGSFGYAGQKLRLESRVALRLCEQKLAKVYEWRPKGKRPAPDVTKGVANA